MDTMLPEIQIANIVASGKINRELDLATVATDLRELDNYIKEVEHSRRSGNRLLIYFPENDALAILAPTGVYVINGVDTYEKVNEARQKLLGALSKLDILSSSNPEPDEIVDKFATQNIVCTAEIGHNLDLNSVAIALGLESTEYEPEQFPGLIYRLNAPKCTILLFATGKLVITGITSEEDACEAVKILTSELNELHLTGGSTN